MKSVKSDGWFAFVLFAALYHCISYYVFGLIFSGVFDYKSLFQQPVISEYYKPYGSVEVYLGPLLQVVRGLLFGIVLLPFRAFFKSERLGWLWLWLLFVVLAILGTPAASPSSLEGAIYSKLPIWFHFLGLPEILLQTLAFSLLLHRKLRSKEHPLPAVFARVLRAFAYACVSFFGYTVVSILFALAAGADISAQSAGIMVLGQFLVPLLLIIAVAIITKPANVAKHVVLYILSVVSIWLYQELILGDAGWLYSLVAPVLPVFISFLLNRNVTVSKNQPPNQKT